MRIVTWNINGLRAVLKRGFGDIASLLDFLKAGKLGSYKVLTALTKLTALVVQT